MNEALAQPEIPHEGAVRAPETLPLLLASLWRREWSGLVIVKGGDVERRLYLQDGRVQTAVSNDPVESLTSMLVSGGALASDDVARAAQHLGAADRGLAFARKLVGLGMVDEAAVLQAEAQRVVSLAETILSSRGGLYRCEVGPPPPEMLPQALDVPRLIATAVLSRWDETWAINVLGGMGSVLKIQLERLPDQEATGADEAYDLTLLRVDGRRTVAQVLAAAPLPDLAAVKFLAACRLLGILEPCERPRRVAAEPAAPPAPRPELQGDFRPEAPTPALAGPRPPAEAPRAAAAAAEADADATAPGYYRPDAGSAPPPRSSPMKEPEPRRAGGAGRLLVIALIVGLLALVAWFGWVGLDQLGGEAGP